MPYFPSFAFFEETITLREVAYLLLSNLEYQIANVGLEIVYESQKETVSMSSKREAISCISSCQSISRFWIEDALNYIGFGLSNTGYLEIDFWDFEPEIYDAKCLTQLMQNQKRNIAILLHETLLEHCRTQISFTSSLDNKAYDDFDIFEFANLLSDSLKQKQFNRIVSLLKSTNKIWLLGVQQKNIPKEILNEELMQRFIKINNCETRLVLESAINQPYFMY